MNDFADFESTTTTIGHPIIFFDEIASTNEWLLAQVDQLPHGSVAVAGFQWAGKGRGKKGWMAEKGTALLLSILLHLDWEAERGSWVTMLAGISTMQAIQRTTTLTPHLKWANDLIVPAGESYRKLGGILTEGHWQNERLISAVVGIGINVNMPAEQCPSLSPPATSILIETGERIHRSHLLDALLREFENQLLQIEAGMSPLPAWREQLWMLGKSVQVIGGNGVVRGVAEGVNEWGQLLVRDSAGKLHTFSAGEVSLRPTIDQPS